MIRIEQKNHKSGVNNIFDITFNVFINNESFDNSYFLISLQLYCMTTVNNLYTSNYVSQQIGIYIIQKQLH